MSKYIDATTLEQELTDNVFRNYTDTFLGVMQIIDEMPAADVAPVRHGEWRNTHHTSIVQCSLCGGTVATLWKGYFCQNCGAKMDGGASHE